MRFWGRLGVGYVGLVQVERLMTKELCWNNSTTGPFLLDPPKSIVSWTT